LVSKTITVAGKGGVGKTAISAMIVGLLSRKEVVLAIDADPSANLNTALGLPLERTVGKAREDTTDDILKGRLAPDINKQDVLDSRIREALVESSRIDLIAMGRPEGTGCYCAANHMLRISIERLTRNYAYVVIDSEAGMEHISRQTTQDVDYLLIVTDPTMRGLTAASRIKDLVKELKTRVGHIYLVVNRVRDSLPPEIAAAVNDFGLDLAGTIAEDPNMPALEIKGKPIIDLPEGSPLRVGVAALLSKIGL
jgi:CO dehydrogenase maturation factor